MDEYFPDHNYSIKCVDDCNPSMPKFRIRGTAGTAIIWHQSIDHLVEPLPDGSDRLSIAMINSSPAPVLLINTHMPTEGAATSDYSEILDEVHQVLDKYNSHIPIWTGDINATLHRPRPTSNDKLFQQFCLENYLQVSAHMPDVPTFHHFNGKSTSTIDLFIHRVIDDPITTIHVLARQPTNTGPHDPVTADVTILHDKKDAPDTRPPKAKVRWDKVDGALYKELTHTRLEALQDQMENMPATVTALRLNSILTKYALEACPPHHGRRSRPSTNGKPHSSLW
jgi:hypothetical protein